MIRRCKKCGYDLHIAAFPFVESRGRRYRRNVCRMCMAKYQNRWKLRSGKTREDRALYARLWRLRQAIQRARLPVK